MRAPKKIYLFENPIDNTPDYRWLTERSGDDDIEYIRSDALIERRVRVFFVRFFGKIVPFFGCLLRE